ncbi:hypothetical protein EYR40_007027 [Pleurotus pulmonarius]|nr:hypothetical protein EYR38_007077 [Pleurotus pulmonarius]KAF4599923.1 hypothetical protein EYR40_007027 [Pleurotus pulmonarius]
MIFNEVTTSTTPKTHPFVEMVQELGKTRNPELCALLLQYMNRRLPFISSEDPTAHGSSPHPNEQLQITLANLGPNNPAE